MSIVSNMRYELTTPTASSGDGVQLNEACSEIVEKDPEYRKAANRIRSFQSYEVDWDGEEGVPASTDVVCLAVSIVRESATAARKADRKWVRPSTSLLNSGSISLLWETKHAQTYIVIGLGWDDIVTYLQLEGNDPLRVRLARSEVLRIIEKLTPVLLLPGSQACWFFSE